MLRPQGSLKVVNIVPTGFIATLRFNQLNPPFDNPAIRRALLGAVQQSDYMIGMVGNDTVAVAHAVRLSSRRTRRWPPMPAWRC